MNRIALFVLIAGISICAAADAVTNLADRLRSAINTLYEAEPSHALEAASLIEDFDLRFAPGRYRPIIAIMSNNWQAVLASLDTYATNRVERLILINTGWWCGDAEFMGYASVLADKVAAGQLDRQEFDSFILNSVFSEGYHGLYALTLRYDEPAVSNLVEKIRPYTSFPSEYWTKVLSGEEKTRFLQDRADGLL